MIADCGKDVFLVRDLCIAASLLGAPIENNKFQVYLFYFFLYYYPTVKFQEMNPSWLESRNQKDFLPVAFHGKIRQLVWELLYFQLLFFVMFPTFVWYQCS